MAVPRSLPLSLRAGLRIGSLSPRLSRITTWRPAGLRATARLTEGLLARLARLSSFAGVSGAANQRLLLSLPGLAFALRRRPLRQAAVSAALDRHHHRRRAEATPVETPSSLLAEPLPLNDDWHADDDSLTPLTTGADEGRSPASADRRLATPSQPLTAAPLDALASPILARQTLAWTRLLTATQAAPPSDALPDSPDLAELALPLAWSVTDEPVAAPGTTAAAPGATAATAPGELVSHWSARPTGRLPRPAAAAVAGTPETSAATSPRPTLPLVLARLSTALSAAADGLASAIATPGSERPGHRRSMVAPPAILIGRPPVQLARTAAAALSSAAPPLTTVPPDPAAHPSDQASVEGAATTSQPLTTAEQAPVATNVWPLLSVAPRLIRRPAAAMLGEQSTVAQRAAATFQPIAAQPTATAASEANPLALAPLALPLTQPTTGPLAGGMVSPPALETRPWTGHQPPTIGGEEPPAAGSDTTPAPLSSLLAHALRSRRSPTSPTADGSATPAPAGPPATPPTAAPRLSRRSVAQAPTGLGVEPAPLGLLHRRSVPPLPPDTSLPIPLRSSLARHPSSAESQASEATVAQPGAIDHPSQLSRTVEPAAIAEMAAEAPASPMVLQTARPMVDHPMPPAPQSDWLRPPSLARPSRLVPGQPAETAAPPSVGPASRLSPRADPFRLVQPATIGRAPQAAGPASGEPLERLAVERPAGLTSEPVTMALQRAHESTGAPLALSARAPLERYFGTRFDEVSIHTDRAAEEATAAVGAAAMTVGARIYFAPGRFQPERAEGRALLAHELTHVIQQRTAPARMALKSLGSAGAPEQSAAEAQAEQVEAQLLAEPATQFSAQALPLVARMPATTPSAGGETGEATPFGAAALGTEGFPAIARFSIDRLPDQPAAQGTSGGGQLGGAAAGATIGGDTPGGGLPGSDVDLIADRVYTLLKERLAIERERRGRWV